MTVLRNTNKVGERVAESIMQTGERVENTATNDKSTPRKKNVFGGKRNLGEMGSGGAKKEKDRGWEGPGKPVLHKKKCVRS